jgi:dipeptidyl aminopeptidase/acylaminoacyl peptidase
MASTQAMEFTSRDELTLHGYLTLPQGKSKSVPLIVMPHGGPHGVRDYWGFDWEVQLLANRGYGVLQLNFRGSSGFGREFLESGYGQWGGTMQNDLTDATQALIDQGIADSKRICMFGTSYGGYAALMGAVKEPDLYRCVIGSAGVYNLPMMFKEGDISQSDSGLVYLKQALGQDQNQLKARSPAFNANKIKADILLIHGRKDKRAPIEQVESLTKALDKAGKPYQYFEISNEAHGYYDEANRSNVYSKVLKFLQQHLGQ